MIKHFIAHRVNTIDALKELPKIYGAEIDIRPYAEELTIHHDPYVKGDSFDEYLTHYQHGTLILNVKAEGVEHRVLELLKQNNITDYFFLDCSFPMINKLSKAGEHRIALRFSEYEGLDTARVMAGRVEWVWVDCFSQLPLNRENYQELKKLGYKLCFVSPELQAQEEKLEQYKKSLQEQGIVLDAVCTKSWNIPKWST